MQSRFRSDRRLTARMGVTLFLLGLLYVAFIAALIVLLKSWVLVVVIAAGLLGAQYWFSDRVALFAMRGRPVEREEYPELHGVVDRLCAIADKCYSPAPWTWRGTRSSCTRTTIASSARGSQDASSTTSRSTSPSGRASRTSS